MAKEIKSHLSCETDEQLQFTLEDRKQVFERIHKLDARHKQKKEPIFHRKLIPAAVSIVCLALCLFLFAPLMLQEKTANELDTSHVANSIVASNGEASENIISTMLLTIKSQQMDNRAYVNLLLAYNNETNGLNVVSWPADTYVASSITPVVPQNKLLFAYQAGGATHIKQLMSTWLDLPIDRYAVIDVQAVSAIVEAMNGLEYDVEEAIQIRGITAPTMTLEQGLQRLTGEEIIGLLMAATENITVKEHVITNVIEAMIDQTDAQALYKQLQKMFTQIETNIAVDTIVEQPLHIASIQTISLHDGMQTKSASVSETEGLFYYYVDEPFLQTIKEQLHTFK